METVAPAPAVQPSFSAGSIIGRSFSVWADNAIAFSVLFLVLHTPALVLGLFAGPAPVPGTRPRPEFFLWSGFNGLVSALLSLTATGALTYGVLQSFNGQRARVGELLGFGLRKIWPVFVVSIDAGIRIFLWALLLFIPGVMAICRFFVAVPVRVAEPGLRSHEAVARSSALTKDHRWSLFVVLLVFWMIAGGTSMLVGVVGLRAGLVPFPVATGITWLVGAVANSLWATAAGVAYHDLRIEKEGVDTAQLVAVFE